MKMLKRHSDGRPFQVKKKLDSDEFFDPKTRQVVHGENIEIIEKGNSRMKVADHPNPRYNHKLYKFIGKS